MNAAELRKQEIAQKRARLEELRRQRTARQAAVASAQTQTQTHAQGQAQTPAGSDSAPGSSSNRDVHSPVGSFPATPRKVDRKEIDDLVDSLLGKDRVRRLSRTATRAESVVSPELGSVAEDEHDALQNGFGSEIARPVVSIGTEARPRRESKPEAPPVVTYTKGTQTGDEDDVELADATRGTDAAPAESQEEIIARLRKEIEAELRLADEHARKARAVAVTREIQTDAPVLSRQELMVEQYRRQLDVEDTPVDQQLKMNCMLVSAQSRRRMVSDLDWSHAFPDLLLAAFNKDPMAPHEPAGLVQLWSMKNTAEPVFTFRAPSDVTCARFSPFHPNLIFGGCFSGQLMVWDTRHGSDPVLKTPLSGRGHTHPISALQIIGTKASNLLVSTSTDGVLCTWQIDLLARPVERVELLAPPPARLPDLAPTCLSLPARDSSLIVLGTEEGTLYPTHRQDRADTKAGIDAEGILRGHRAFVTSCAFHPPVSKPAASSSGVSAASSIATAAAAEMQDLLLTSSLDWSVKLWRVKQASHGGGVDGLAGGARGAYPSTLSNMPGLSSRLGKRMTSRGYRVSSGASASSGRLQASTATSLSRRQVSGAASSTTTAPASNPFAALDKGDQLLHFANDDPVYDVKWSPARFAVFATVDAKGEVKVYNLARSVDVPVASLIVRAGAGVGADGTLTAAAAAAAAATAAAGQVASGNQADDEVIARGAALNKLAFNRGGFTTAAYDTPSIISANTAGASSSSSAPQNKSHANGDATDAEQSIKLGSATATATAGSGGPPASTQRIVQKAWHARPGSIIAVGGISGVVTLLDCGPDVAPLPDSAGEVEERELAALRKHLAQAAAANAR